MERFLIVSPHSTEDCKKTIQEVMAMGYITHFDWGCKDGEHTGWAVIEADNAKEALLVVPALQRNKARAIKLTKFAPEDIMKSH